MIISSPINIKAYGNSKNNSISNDTDKMLFSKELNDKISERFKTSDDNNLLMNNTNLSELPTLHDCEVSEAKTNDSISQDENDEDTEVKDDIIFDIFEYCYECEDRENCAHYLGMTGADEEEIEKAISISKKSNKAFSKVGNIIQEQLFSSIKSSIIYNYSLICPDTEKKVKRDK